MFLQITKIDGEKCVINFYFLYKVVTSAKVYINLYIKYKYTPEIVKLWNTSVTPTTEDIVSEMQKKLSSIYWLPCWIKSLWFVY